jgi:hypothetical protein
MLLLMAVACRPAVDGVAAVSLYVLGRCRVSLMGPVLPLGFAWYCSDGGSVYIAAIHVNCGRHPRGPRPLPALHEKNQQQAGSPLAGLPA